MFVERNCFERQTDVLGKIDIRTQILKIHQVSDHIAKLQYQSALQLIKYCQQTIQFEEESMYYEFQLMQAFCQYQLKNIDKTKQICKGVYEQLQQEQKQVLQRSNSSMHQKSISRSSLAQELKRSFSIRFYTFVISVCIRGQDIGIRPKQILERLIRILRIDKCIYLPEVLGTLTGCRSFKHVEQVRFLHGEQNQRKAKKLELLATWKYLINQHHESAKFKKEALMIWKKQNLLKQKEKCEEELKQLLGNLSDPNVKGKYIKRLDRAYFFIHQLIPLESQIKEISKKTNLKYSLPMLINSLYAQDTQKKSENISLSQSKLVRANDKMTQLNAVIHKVEDFYETYKKQRNNQITSLIFNSKFMDERMKQIRTKLLILSKIRRYSFKIAFPFIKECAIARAKKFNKSKIVI